MKKTWSSIIIYCEKIRQKLYTLPRGKQIYWCYDVRSTNILVLLVLAAPIGEEAQTFYNFKNFVDFLSVCSANILVLNGLQHQYIGAVQGESKCLQLNIYSVKHCLFNQLE
jgi:hypothetical protein